MQGDVAQTKFKGIMQTGGILNAEGGVGAFYRGFGLRVGLMTTTFFLVNRLKLSLVGVMFPQLVEAN